MLLDVGDQLEESYHQLKVAHRLAPTNAGVLFQLSLNRLAATEMGQALEYLEQTIKLDPENPHYHAKLSHLYERMGESEKARLEAQRAQSLRSAFQTYLEAIKLASKSLHQEAIRHLRPVIIEHPDFLTGTMLLADLYRKMGHKEDALELYLQVIERNPHHSDAREQAAWIQAEEGSLDSAVELLQGSYKLSPNRVLIEGYRELVHENWAGALERFRKAELLHPLDPRLLQLISFCLNAQGKKEEALRYLDKADKLEPGNPEVFRQAQEIRLEMGDQFIREGRWSAAKNTFEELINREGPKADYLLNRGYCRQSLGDLTGAIQDYRYGLRLDPDAIWARINLATSLLVALSYQESSAEWERVLRTEKNQNGTSSSAFVTDS